jgi:hypothetical protein
MVFHTKQADLWLISSPENILSDRANLAAELRFCKFLVSIVFILPFTVVSDEI